MKLADFSFVDSDCLLLSRAKKSKSKNVVPLIRVVFKLLHYRLISAPRRPFMLNLCLSYINGTKRSLIELTNMFTEYRHVLQCLYPSTAAYPNIFLVHEASHNCSQWQLIFISLYALQCTILTHSVWLVPLLHMDHSV